MQFHFSKEQLSDFENNIRKEWSITNGIGGYAGSSILGAHNRTHQGYLIASLHSPVERYVVFSKTNERFVQDGTLYDLETSQHAASPKYKEGNLFLTDFIYDGTVAYAYQAGSLSFEKHISMVQGKNRVVLAYGFTNEGDDVSFTITPLMNFREHNASSTPETLVFEVATAEHSFTLVPAQKRDYRIVFSFSDGVLSPRTDLYDIDMQLQTEVDNETDGLDCHFTPFDLSFTIPAHSHKQFSVVCEILPESDYKNAIFEPASNTAFIALKQEQEYLASLIDRAGYKDDDFANTLVISANQFLSYRQSTGLMTVLAGLPWFTDWGRDTMIAFSGLTLATHRYQEAEEILKTFAQYVHHGMIPNMFPDGGQAPLYNTADASLWYFYAVDQYLHYVNTDEARLFIQKDIYPALKEIIHAYQTGTDFSIYMDTDGLIHAGSGLDQVTWMDVRVGEWVVTPRHGKPVEINALWYNALCVMEQLSKAYGEDSSVYTNLAQKVRTSFCEKFWYEEGQYLYDVIDEDECDTSLRPNQIYAVSLPYTMLDDEKANSVVKIVHEKLYAERGLRSLSQSHPDYHPIYLGALPKRDAAYHQGTAWGFLMGGFITAYTKVHHHSKDSIAQALEFLRPVKEQFYEGGIGSISEIFDGDAPHHCRGCYAQAWSVGEVLRCYTEDILPYI